MHGIYIGQQAGELAKAQQRGVTSGDLVVAHGRVSGQAPESQHRHHGRRHGDRSVVRQRLRGHQASARADGTLSGREWQHVATLGRLGIHGPLIR